MLARLKKWLRRSDATVYIINAPARIDERELMRAMDRAVRRGTRP
jgi:hypothetical protein